MIDLNIEMKKIVEYHNSLLKKAERKSNIEIERIVQQTIDDYIAGRVNFENINSFAIKQGTNKRIVKQYTDWSTEMFLCIYLKRCLDKEYKIKYPNRNDHMHLLFGVISSICNMKDYVIVKFDFEDFFNSISSEYIYHNYISSSGLERSQRDLFHDFVLHCPYCYAGINTSNIMAEIVSNYFDKLIKILFNNRGLIFYRRYVDDGILVFNKYISEDECKKIIEDAINKAFFDDNAVVNKCKTRLNYKQGKSTYISKRNLDSAPNTTFIFNYLGYQFCLTAKDSQTEIKYGITKEKIQKYSQKIEEIIDDYILNNDIELLRHKLRAFTTRTVYRRKKYTSMIWKVKGFTSNYNELRYHLSQLDSDTIEFLTNGIKSTFVKKGVAIPYFIKDTTTNSPYILFNNLKNNRTLLFEENERIGINAATLKQMCQQIGIIIPENMPYNSMVREYLMKIKVGH